jgi:hypothetical protein
VPSCRLPRAVYSTSCQPSGWLVGTRGVEPRLPGPRPGALPLRNIPWSRKLSQPGRLDSRRVAAGYPHFSSADQAVRADQALMGCRAMACDVEKRGLEPRACRLRAGCSSAELHPQARVGTLRFSPYALGLAAPVRSGSRRLPRSTGCLAKDLAVHLYIRRVHQARTVAWLRQTASPAWSRPVAGTWRRHSRTVSPRGESVHRTGCGACGTRTRDLLHAMQTRYLLR